MRQLPRTLSCPITIRREDAQFAPILVVASHLGSCSYTELAAEILGETEKAYYSTIRSARRQESYVLGRYAAKVALTSVVSAPTLKAVEIDRGVFDQPVVRCDWNERWDVTISHAANLAVAVAYPAEHPMGVDIEQINPAQHETILSQLSEQETGWVNASSTSRIEIATALWAAKEALSKVLRTGLMSPIQIYNLIEFTAVAPGIREGLFQNFGQYKARVWIGSSYVLSIVLPKRSALTSESDFRPLL